VAVAYRHAELKHHAPMHAPAVDVPRCVLVVLQAVRELAVPAGWEGQDQDLVALLTQETVQVGGYNTERQCLG
jgi:hypothetical protein